MITALAFVVLGAAGAIVRASVKDVLGTPWGTLLVNVLGAFALGLLVGSTRFAHTAVGIGALGALTTFSTFAFEQIELHQRGRSLGAALYAVGTPITGVVAATLGIWLVS